MRRFVAIAACAVAIATPGRAHADGPSGVERIALVGSTFIEREQEYGYLETRLALDDPSRVRIVRNLGWSGDNVWGESRHGFGTPADGFKQLRQQVMDFRPTTILVCYGAVESYDGPSGLPRFREGLNTLLDMLAESKAKLILASPTQMENLGPPLPDPRGHNLDVDRYRDVIRDVAASRKVAFLDLSFLRELTALWGRRLTDDGLQYGAYGYWAASKPIAAAAFEVRASAWSLSTGMPSPGPGQEIASQSTGLHDYSVGVLKAGETNVGLRFVFRADRLPPPNSPGVSPGPDLPSLRVRGLLPADARFTLRIDGRPAQTETGGVWFRGVALGAGPDFDQVERLRKAIVAKNLLFFYRWRPQNETYLFGFRKHEQGNNAREIPMFDPLIAAAEAEIERLRIPAVHTYEITREGEAAR